MFWDGADGGSVRRYRLDLPPESPEEEGAAVIEKLSFAREDSAGAVVVRRDRAERDERRRERREKRRRERSA